MKSENIWRVDIQQRVLRDLVEVFSRPGTVRDLANYVEPASTYDAVLATLMDGETSLADPHAILAKPDWRLLQVRHSACEQARFILADGKRVPDFVPALGTLASPDFGATLLIKVAALGHGPLSMTLSGPGISGQRELHMAGLQVDWLTQRANWVAEFPLGVDIILCGSTHIAALPRTTRVSINAINEGAA